MNFTLQSKKIFRPTDYGKAFAKLCQMNLSPQEERVVEALRRVNSETIYGIAIRNAFIDESPAKFRKLFNELLSQIDDNDLLMLKILGSDCYNALLKIKPCHE